MEIRLATTQDYDAIAALNAEVQAVHAEAEPQVFKPPTLDMFSRETFDAILSNPAQSIYIGCIGNTPIGYMFVEIRDEPESAARYGARYLIIHHLGVSAAHRGNGYGEQLHRATLALARAQVFSA